MHSLKLKSEYFLMIKNGVKTYELRLYDEKRQKIQINDLIEFTDLKSSEKIKVKVVSYITAPNFALLADKINISEAGFETKDNLIKTLAEIYDSESIQKYGVIAFKISLIQKN